MLHRFAIFAVIDLFFLASGVAKEPGIQEMEQKIGWHDVCIVVILEKMTSWLINATHWVYNQMIKLNQDNNPK